MRSLVTTFCRDDTALRNNIRAGKPSPYSCNPRINSNIKTKPAPFEHSACQFQQRASQAFKRLLLSKPLAKMRLSKKALLSLHSPLKCSFTPVNCAFSGFASLKIALFIQPLKMRTTQFLLLGRSLFLFAESTNRIIQYNSFRFIHQSQKFFHDAKILQRNTVCNNKISLNINNPITTYWYIYMLWAVINIYGRRNTKSGSIVINNYIFKKIKHYSYCLHPESILFLHSKNKYNRKRTNHIHETLGTKKR